MAGTAVVLQLISILLCCVSGAYLQYGSARLSGPQPNVTLTVGVTNQKVYCGQDTVPVPTSIRWYNPQGQLVSSNNGDEVSQAAAAGGGRIVALTFQSYLQSQGGKYECRVNVSGNNSETLSVCIGPTMEACILPPPTEPPSMPSTKETPEPTNATPSTATMPTVAPRPSKVMGVRVTPSVQGTSPTLTVTWQALAEGAVTYTVKYSTQPGEVNTPPEGALEVMGISGTSTVLTALQRGTTYYIWVVWVSEGGEGPHSDRKSGVAYDMSGAYLLYGSTRLSGPQPNVTLTVGETNQRVYCGQDTGPVPTSIEWYNPQGQLVSSNNGDEVSQAAAAGGGRIVALTFQSYQQSQGGKYECRVAVPGNNSETLSVCIGSSLLGLQATTSQV